MRKLKQTERKKGVELAKLNVRNLILYDLLLPDSEKHQVKKEL